MNERIKEIEKQCWQSTQSEPHALFDVKKFAELIVGECMTTVLKESKYYWDKDEFESSNAIQNAARRVKEYFGVEV